MKDSFPSFSLEKLAKLTNSEIVGDSNYIITNVNNLEEAQPHDISFFSNPKYKPQLKITKAGAILISPKDYDASMDSTNYLINENPSSAFNQLIEIFLSIPSSGFNAIHPTVVIHETAVIGKNVQIEPYTVIAQGVIIGDNTKIGSHCYIGALAKIGSSCILHSHVTIRENCILGNKNILQPGAVIGSCGFGYVTNANGEHSLLKQLGNVILEDDVHIGANTTIDRARFQSTIIKKGTKIDNLVQIGHQVTIGEHSLLVAQVGIAGSTKVGSHVVMGGKTGVAGHINICSQTMFMACSAISKSITEPGIYGGIPAKPKKTAQEIYVASCKAPYVHKKVAILEKKIAELIDKKFLTIP